MSDLLIKNGTVFDGLGNPGKKLDLAIKAGHVSEISESIAPDRKQQVIDATGLYVAPGFIDIQNHSDSYWTIFDQPDQTSLLSQGITSIVVGNCGSSLAPLASPESLKTIQKWHDLSGINVNWSTFAEYLEALRSQNPGVNIGSLVGHATLRRGLLGDSVREITSDEVQTMEKMLSDSLDQGALGLSLGLLYAHEMDSGFEELLELSRKLKEQHKLLSVHLRSEGVHTPDAIDEVVELGRKLNVPVHISHLKVRGEKNWHLLPAVINKLENAYHQGVDISFNVYPYDSAWPVLYTYLPKWAYEGGRAEILRRLIDTIERRKILDYLKTQDYNLDKVIVAAANGNPGFIGKSITQIASNQGVTAEEAVLNIITASKTEVMIFDHNILDEHYEALMTSPLSIIATDGVGYSKKMDYLVHPRCFGGMVKALRLVREKKLMKWEELIKKMTSEPARLIGISDRGVLAKNYLADVVVFDPKTVADSADFLHPFRYASGISNVIVNGQMAFADFKLIGRHGQILSR